MHNFRNLDVWRDSISLVTEIYRLSNNFPKNEKFGLTSQIQRSATSIPSNIAEGAGRNTNGEFINHLGIALGSSYELETQCWIAKNLGYLSQGEMQKLTCSIQSIQKRISRFIQTLKIKRTPKVE